MPFSVLCEYFKSFTIKCIKQNKIKGKERLDGCLEWMAVRINLLRFYNSSITLYMLWLILKKHPILF